MNTFTIVIGMCKVPALDEILLQWTESSVCVCVCVKVQGLPHVTRREAKQPAQLNCTRSSSHGLVSDHLVSTAYAFFLNCLQLDTTNESFGFIDNMATYVNKKRLYEIP